MLFVATRAMTSGAELTLGGGTLRRRRFDHQNVIAFFFIRISLLKWIGNEMTRRYNITIFITLF